MKKLTSLLLFTLISNFSFAFKFSPMVISINPSAPNNKTKVTVENDSFEKMAIEISVSKRIMDQQGNETWPAVKNDFLIYPGQIILNPKEKRAVQIRWTSKKRPTRELAYRLIVEQLPIDFEKKKKKESSIKIQMRYLGALYVTPKNATAIITLEKIKKLKNNNDIELFIKNSGNKHAILRNLKLDFSVEAFGNIKKKYQLKGDQLKGMNGENVLAANSRKFIVPLPKELKNKIYKKLSIKMYFDQE